MSDCTKENKILEHQLEEWKTLNDYLNKIDLGYQQSMVLVISVFAVVATVTTQWKIELIKGIFIVPLGLVAVFAYLSYQFRITAIIRGHLATLEEKMNKHLKEDVHMWNSALVETFMAHNNGINKFMMVPMVMFIFLLIGYCIHFSWIALADVNYRVAWMILYWSLVIIGAIIDFVPLLNNETIRTEIRDEDKVKTMYKKYLKEAKNKRVSYEKTDEEKRKR